MWSASRAQCRRLWPRDTVGTAPQSQRARAGAVRSAPFESSHPRCTGGPLRPNRAPPATSFESPSVLTRTWSAATSDMVSNNANSVWRTAKDRTTQCTRGVFVQKKYVAPQLATAPESMAKSTPAPARAAAWNAILDTVSGRPLRPEAGPSTVSGAVTTHAPSALKAIHPGCAPRRRTLPGGGSASMPLPDASVTVMLTMSPPGPGTLHMHAPRVLIATGGSSSVTSSSPLWLTARTRTCTGVGVPSASVSTT